MKAISLGSALALCLCISSALANTSLTKNSSICASSLEDEKLSIPTSIYALYLKSKGHQHAAQRGLLRLFSEQSRVSILPLLQSISPADAFFEPSWANYVSDGFPVSLYEAFTRLYDCRSLIAALTAIETTLLSSFINDHPTQGIALALSGKATSLSTGRQIDIRAEAAEIVTDILDQTQRSARRMSMTRALEIVDITLVALWYYNGLLYNFRSTPLDSDKHWMKLEVIPRNERIADLRARFERERARQAEELNIIFRP